MTKCPCCGFREGSGNPLEIARTLRLNKSERAMFGVFASRFGAFLSTRELADAVYADHPDGGPEHADSCIHVAMSRFKSKVAASGLEIDTQPGPGGGRRMVWAKTGRAAKK